LGWVAIVIWFSANLLSQAFYIGFNGEPYNANAILSNLGNWYWFFIVIELLFWVTLGLLIMHKLRINTDDDTILESV